MFYKYFKYSFIALFCVAFLPRCARIGGITGGPKDTLAPVLVRVDPGDGAVHFDRKRIVFEFDEYVQLKNLQREFYTSPGMKKIPTVTLRGRGFRVDILDTLREGQTYSLNFAGSVVDNHEGNPLHGFRYVFSTGGEIDSMVMSGYAEDASKGDSVSKAFVYFFDAALDSIPDYDSVMFKHLPEAIGRAENNGIFVARNLKPKPYRVYVIEDANSNKQYDAGVDRVGFLDSVYNPAGMEDFEAWYDTTRSYVTARPQLYFRMFMDERPSRQILQTPTRPVQHKVMMTFGAPRPRIERLHFEGVDSTRVIREYLKPTRDSMALWIDMEVPPDTLRGEIVYMKPDSTGVEVPFRQELKLGWRKSESNAEKRERERRERDIAEGKRVDSLPNPFKVTLPSGDINPERGLEMEFEMPLSAVDQGALRLTRGDSADMRRVAVRMEPDTASVRKWRVQAQWVEGQRYRLLIPPGALRNVAGQTNDSIVRAYDVIKADDKATIAVEVKGKSSESLYVVQLTDASGGRVLDEKRGVSTGTVTFRYVDPGQVRLKILDDANGDGEWNTGSLVRRLQPERVEFYVKKEDEPAFTVRAGWVEKEVLDMEKIFAPVTIESVWKRLQRDEGVRLEKLIETLAKAREERRRREQQGTKGPSAMDMMQGATGLNLPGF